MTIPQSPTISERMTILGDLDAPTFLPWIRRHAAKLGLRQTIAHVDAARIDLDVAGPVELIDMMEMGCSLGPIDVWVETIERRPAEAWTGPPVTPPCHAPRRNLHDI